MSRRLLINCRPDERRVAVIENGLTTELFFERFDKRNAVGNIYKGRVVRVLPGMQSAFVEVGLARTAFLFVGDAVPEEEPEREEEEEAGAEQGATVGGRGERYPRIDTLIREGQQLLVQVTKEPISHKGARLTTHISIPGRYLVLRPYGVGLGISRRILDPAERTRLRGIAETLAGEGFGLIVRTAAEGQDQGALQEDLAYLQRTWTQIGKRADVARAPELIYEDLDVTLRSVRDLITSDGDRILVDSDHEAERIRRFIDDSMPEHKGRIEVWEGAEPMFTRFGLDWEISRAMRPKVWLRSGGYIIIEHTEALTAIDVNSGRNVGSQSFEETVFEINLEAVREIAYQLRFRDIGGLIVIDFIDMEYEDNRALIYEALSDAVAEDKARTRILPMSDFGLMEMTRKRVRESIVKTLTEECFYCEGRGFLRSAAVVADDILMRLRQRLARKGTYLPSVTAHPRVIELLVHEFGDELAEIERRAGVPVELRPDGDTHLEHFVVG